MGQDIFDFETVALCEERDCIRIIDQTLLPGNVVIEELHTAEQVWNAIYLLKVRGAPAIGVTAAMAMYLLVNRVPIPEGTGSKQAYELLRGEFDRQKAYLASSRPTAVNLFWALDRMDRAFTACGEGQYCSAEEIKDCLRREAAAIRDEDIEVCRKIGEHGLALLKPGDGILTHCNAGRLATIRYGTATAPIYLGQERGYGFHVYADETRPLLQGARLTAFELQAAGVDVTLLCDNMAASLMRAGKIQAVLVGCDRVAANGDAANKIGTSAVAAVAAYYHVPFYVCAPTSTIDSNARTGKDIVIEHRRPEEVTEMWYKERMAPEGVKVYNPAFDVTDHELITGIITENGVLKP